MSYFAWERKGRISLDEGFDEAYQADETFREQAEGMFASLIEVHDHLGNYCFIDDVEYRLQGYLLRSAPMPISWIVCEKIYEELEGYWEPPKTDNEYAVGSAGGFLRNVIKAL